MMKFLAVQLIHEMFASGSNQDFAIRQDVIHHTPSPNDLCNDKTRILFAVDIIHSDTSCVCHGCRHFRLPNLWCRKQYKEHWNSQGSY